MVIHIATYGGQNYGGGWCFVITTLFEFYPNGYLLLRRNARQIQAIFQFVRVLFSLKVGFVSIEGDIGHIGIDLSPSLQIKIASQNMHENLIEWS